MDHEKQVVSIVDDDPSARRGLKRLLAAAGHETRAYASARELLADIHSLGSGCIVSDILMPECDGFALHEEVRRIAPWIPVIFVTAHDDAMTRRRAESNGAAGCFAKPVDGPTLLDAVRSAMGGIRNERG